MIQIFLRIGCLVSLLLCCISPARAATAHILAVDLPALIDQVADQPERFAVNVPQQISASTEGQWTSSGATRIWNYSVQVPTAVSLSFHASHVVLPSSAVLTVTGGRATVVYRARDVSRGGLWGRPLIGDTVSLSLSVTASGAGGV